MRISKYSEFNLQSDITSDFLFGFDKLVTEDENSSGSYKKIEKKVMSDLKLNTELALTFGAGIGAFYPIVDSLLKNLSTESIEVTQQTVVMLTITAITIIFIEEKKFKNSKQEEILTRDSKSLLEELRMRGVGDGIVKKVIKALKSVKNIFNLITKHLGAVVGGFMDMFAYSSLLIPIMNGISYIIGKYDLNLDSIIHNFMILSMGIGTMIAKHGIADLIDRLKGNFPLDKKQVIGELETPVIQKFGDMTHGDDSKQGGDLIKERK
jgi:hypothetical protein